MIEVANAFADENIEKQKQIGLFYLRYYVESHLYNFKGSRVPILNLPGHWELQKRNALKVYFLYTIYYIYLYITIISHCELTKMHNYLRYKWRLPRLIKSMYYRIIRNLKKKNKTKKTLSIRNPRRTRSLRFFESLYIYLYSSLKQTDKNTIYKFS